MFQTSETVIDISYDIQTKLK